MTVAAVGAAEGAGAAGAGAGAAEGAAAGRAAGGASKTAGKGGRLSDMASGVGVGDALKGRGKFKGSGHAASSARRLLVAEFVLCMVVLAFSPLTGKSPSAAAFMKRGSAIIGLFFLLGLISTAGRGAARASAGLGGLVTLVLLISDRSIFTKLAGKFQPGVGEEIGDLGGLDAQDEFDQDDTDEVPDPGVRPVPDNTGTLTPLQPAGPLGNGIR